MNFGKEEKIDCMTELDTEKKMILGYMKDLVPEYLWFKFKPKVFE
tara:strand:- start:556 stop:690 length:135 start_codon:yes stop_codon:yes gene_type:complete